MPIIRDPVEGDIPFPYTEAGFKAAHFLAGVTGFDMIIEDEGDQMAGMPGGMPPVPAAGGMPVEAGMPIGGGIGGGPPPPMGAGGSLAGMPPPPPVAGMDMGAMMGGGTGGGGMPMMGGGAGGAPPVGMPPPPMPMMGGAPPVSMPPERSRPKPKKKDETPSKEAKSRATRG